MKIHYFLVLGISIFNPIYSQDNEEITIQVVKKNIAHLISIAESTENATDNGFLKILRTINGPVVGDIINEANLKSVTANYLVLSWDDIENNNPYGKQLLQNITTAGNAKRKVLKAWGDYSKCEINLYRNYMNHFGKENPETIQWPQAFTSKKESEDEYFKRLILKNKNVNSTAENALICCMQLYLLTQLHQKHYKKFQEIDSIVKK